MSWDQVEQEMENVEKIVQAMETEEEEDKGKETKVEVTSEVRGRVLQPSLSGSEPGTVIRTSTDVGSPPSYRRFSSPRPPRFTIERKMSAGILRTNESGSIRKKSGSAEPTSPAPSVDRLSVTFADLDDSKEDSEQVEKKVEEEKSEAAEMNPELTVEAIEVLGADVVATLGEPTEEYTDSILELQRSKSRGSSNVVSQDPSGRRRSSGGGHRRGSSMSSSIFQGISNSF